MPENEVYNKGFKSVILGIFINMLLAIIKGIAGYFGNSYALIADAIESVSDVFSSIVVYFGLKVASLKPSKSFPYGHGKAEPMAGALVSLSLIGAGIFIIVNSITNIRTPHEIPESYTLLILIVVIVSKELLFRYVVKAGELVSSSAIKADAWHHRSDAISSAAVFLGILIALIGGKGYESADDWAALLASGIIIYNAWRILIPAIKEIMDAAPPDEMILEVKRIAETVDGVLGLDKCLIRKTGFDYYVDIHVVVNGDISVKKGHDIAHKVKDEILNQDKRIGNVFVHIEPYDPEYSR